jgi:hypothetical protein
MRSIPLQSAITALIVFILFSMLLFLAGIPPFVFPHIPMFAIYICSEKNLNKKATFLLLALFFYSQFATPFPFLFLIFISFQIYLVGGSVFNVSVFDFSLSALISGFFIQLILNVNRMVYYYAFTGTIPIYSTLVYVGFSSTILLAVFLFFKPHIDRIFIKDTWL